MKPVRRPSMNRGTLCTCESCTMSMCARGFFLLLFLLRVASCVLLFFFFFFSVTLCVPARRAEREMEIDNVFSITT